MCARARGPRQARLRLRAALAGRQRHAHAPAPPPPQDRALRREPPHAGVRRPRALGGARGPSPGYILLPQIAHGHRERRRALLLRRAPLLLSRRGARGAGVRRATRAVQGAQRGLALQRRRDCRQRGWPWRFGIEGSEAKGEASPPSSPSPPPQNTLVPLSRRRPSTGRRTRGKVDSTEKNRFALSLHP